jgi:excinuclease ABC subunit B
MYADTMTKSMTQAIDETNRRREKQVAYNLEHGINPEPLRKKIADITEMLAREEADTVDLLAAPTPTNASSATRSTKIGAEGAKELEEMIRDLNDQMLLAAAELKFELAARLRDELSDIKRELRIMKEAGHA